MATMFLSPQVQEYTARPGCVQVGSKRLICLQEWVCAGSTSARTPGRTASAISSASAKASVFFMFASLMRRGSSGPAGGHFSVSPSPATRNAL